ncbi:hypothetical protein J2129_001521 [Methanofollis sp. W23]|nr:hypothetical protein [Methanofollis sp. W23]
MLTSGDGENLNNHRPARKRGIITQMETGLTPQSGAHGPIK